MSSSNELGVTFDSCLAAYDYINSVSYHIIASVIRQYYGSTSNGTNTMIVNKATFLSNCGDIRHNTRVIHSFGKQHKSTLLPKKLYDLKTRSKCHKFGKLCHRAPEHLPDGCLRSSCTSLSAASYVAGGISQPSQQFDYTIQFRMPFATAQTPVTDDKWACIDDMMIIDQRSTDQISQIPDATTAPAIASNKSEINGLDQPN